MKRRAMTLPATAYLRLKGHQAAPRAQPPDGMSTSARGNTSTCITAALEAMRTCKASSRLGHHAMTWLIVPEVDLDAAGVVQHELIEALLPMQRMAMFPARH